MVGFRFRVVVLLQFAAVTTTGYALTATPTRTTPRDPNPIVYRMDLDENGVIDSRDVYLFLEGWQERDFPTLTPTPSVTDTPDVTPSLTKTLTPTPTVSSSPSSTPTSTQTPTLTPTQAAIPPYIRSIPPTSALVGEEYLYLLVASDPNEDPLSFQLLSGPGGMVVSATGLVAWTPHETGRVAVSLGVADGGSQVVQQKYYIDVGLSEEAASAFISHSSGGVVEVDDPGSPIVDARLVIPPGSLPEDATVTIQSISNSHAFFPEALPLRIAGLEGAAATVTIDVPYDLDALATFNEQPEDLLVFIYDPSNDEWIALPKSQSKVEKIGVVTATIGAALIGIGVSHAIVAGSELYYRLYLQSRKILPEKGTLTEFFDCNSSKRRLLLIHGVLSSPETFHGTTDFLPPEGSNPLNSLQTSLWNHYDSVVSYRYPSARRIDENAERLMQQLVQGYAQAYGGRPPVSLGANPNFECDLLTHSMGGMVARWFLERGSGRAVLGKMVTLGTPHYGFGQYDDFANALFYVSPPIAAIRASFPSIAQLANGLDEADEFLGVLNQINPPQGAARYYAIAGLRDNSLIPISDRWVTVASALFLNLDPSHEQIFGDNEDQGAGNNNFEHGNLHALANNNGVGQQVLFWLGVPGALPNLTPTPTSPAPLPTASPTPTRDQTIGPHTEVVEFAVYQHVVHVSAQTGSDIAGDGSSGNPWASITYALSQIGSANAGNRYAILVTGGLYGESGITMRQWVDLYGGFDPSDWEDRDVFAHETVVSGGGQGIVIAASNARIDGFTLTGGSRGIYVSSASPLITNNTIRGNLSGSGDGGGIYCGYSAPIIRNNLIDGNSGSDGAGMDLYYCSNQSSIKYNTISSNSSSRGGGGIYLHQTDAKLEANMVYDNTAYEGAGIYVAYSAPQIQNCLIYRNITDDNSYGEGGGLYGSSSEGMVIVNCTIWGNRGWAGGGLYLFSTSLTKVLNTVLYENETRSTGPQIGGNTPIVSYCNIQGGLDPANHNIAEDPLFVAPGLGDFHLSPDSPCIDQGRGPSFDADVPLTDLDSDFRGDGIGGVGVCDIGADEFVGR